MTSSHIGWAARRRTYRQGRVKRDTKNTCEPLAKAPARRRKRPTKNQARRQTGLAAIGALDDKSPTASPAAGYENEAASNAAFDPVEYVDVLLATGHRPVVICDSKGEARYYYEQVPHRRQTKAEEAAELAVRRKYCAASNALERVKQECIRRGLVDAR